MKLRVVALLVAALSLGVPACAGESESGPAGSEGTTPSPSQAAERSLTTAAGGEGVTTDTRYMRSWLLPNDSGPPRYLVVTDNPLGQGLVFLIRKELVTRTGDKWFEVWLPERPNGLTGWVRAEDVRVVRLDERVEVDLSERTLVHFANGEVAHRFSVGVGSPENPTPTGTFYVWSHQRQPDPEGPYGAYAFGMSGFSPNLSDWAGNGRVAIHGTADPADRGRPVSHGCVRVYNEDIVELKHLPMGTPVIIEA